VHDDSDAGFRQPAELVEVTEAVDKTRRPTIAAAGGFCGFGEPDRLPRCKAIAERVRERETRIRPCQPFV